MTEIQSGQGVTAERLKKSKFETIETIKAGEFAQRNVWPDIVAFMLDEGMLLAEQAYGWDDYCRLKFGMAGTGSGGEGWKQQEWIRFQKILGYMHLRVLHELWDWPVPQFGNDGLVKDSKWRLNQCMHRVRNALGAASHASQEARKDMESLRNPKKRLPSPENSPY